MTDEQQYRAAAGFVPDFNGRTIEGKLVPFGGSTDVSAPGFRGKEAFSPSAFNHQLAAANRVPLFLDHGPLGGKLIGRMDSLRAQHDGLYGKAVISKTSDGNDALELIRDGVYPGLSVGFKPVTNSLQPDGTVLRTKANLFELAVVREGAYPDAVIHALRTAGDRCPSCGQFGQTEAHGMDEARTDAHPNSDATTRLLQGLGLRLPPLPS